MGNRFAAFAARECKGSSPLYEHLSENIAGDHELLSLASFTQKGQPVPNLLFGAVHYLLLQGYEHELKTFYRSVTPRPREAAEAFPYFRDFCQQHRDDILPLLQQKLVQTNEVRRCAYLYPAFCYIHERAKRPLALIEIGTSAGLQLLWDQYCYFYDADDHGNNYEHGDGYGRAASKVHIRTEIKGEHRPFLLRESPQVTTKIGVDLHVNDMHNSEDLLWLKALIWPEHTERIAVFEQAAQCLKQQNLTLIEGDGIQLLPKLSSQIAEDCVLCVFHTHVANQFPLAAKHELTAHIQSIGKQRDIFHLYNNMWDWGQLHLDYCLDGKEYQETLAETDGHGRWFRWKM
ncbi:DUF2332 domain-containing protein [Paenibacillus sp. GCM10027626]|uniref:DUF2332 domain-containing protein n=1 Tax=Paenibacillus sp. GCM10027626 TaxID=3273411 RepID=UPI00362FC8AD